MNNQTKEKWEKIFIEKEKNVIIEDGLINLGRPGHTIEASKVQGAHEGRSTAAYYAIGTALGRLNPDKGLELLHALRELQVTDESSPIYGGFRWYREETRVNDTNAAFFILMPLVVLRLKLEYKVPGAHLELLDKMMDQGIRWFSKEIKKPILYYPNKILSDGALLLGLSRLLNRTEDYHAAVLFFEKWLDYTERRGWGWGENASLGYTQIIVNALRIAGISLKPEDHDLELRLQEVEQSLFEYVRFHDGKEYVPTIRSYNFDGHVEVDSLLWSITGVSQKSQGYGNMLEDTWSGISMLLFEEEIQNNTTNLQPIPRERKERIFDESYAYSWIGNTGRLGSLNRFPVIHGSYQFPTYGLAWQTFPVSFAVEEEQIGFLRWYVHDGERVRTHPAINKQKTYLSPALFGESWYPDVQLRSTQRENGLVVVRSMSGVNNRASEISDQWVIQRFKGKVSKEVDETGRSWIVLHYPNSRVVITALRGINNETKIRTDCEIKVELKDEILLLTQQLYSGDCQEIHHPRLETGWVLFYLDNVNESQTAQNWLQGVHILDDSLEDGEVPRHSHTEIRQIRVERNGEELLALTVDPYKSDIK